MHSFYTDLGPEHTGHFVQPHVAAHCGGPEHTRATCGGHMYVMYANALSVARLSHKLQCARQSLKIMVSYGNKYPRHNPRPHVVEQSGQCARALRDAVKQITPPNYIYTAHKVLICNPLKTLFTCCYPSLFEYCGVHAVQLQPSPGGGKMCVALSVPRLSSQFNDDVSHVPCVIFN